jgi:hypothetical protein
VGKHDRSLKLSALDTLNLVAVLGPASIIAIYVTDAWLPRMLVWLAVAVVIALPVKRLLRPLYLRARAMSPR